MSQPASPLNLVALDEVAPQPWRNGGGQTRELLAWPDAADWSLRISVADIAADGPFSAFPDIERWFAVISGAGVELQHAARRATLLPGAAPWHFDGADAPDARLIDGRTSDLNLMLRRDRGRGAMQRAVPAVAWTAGASFRAVFCASAMTLDVDDVPGLPLAPSTLAWSAGAAGQRWCLHALVGTAPKTKPAVAAEPAAWWLEFSLRP